jgi:serine protease Do
MKDLTKGLTVGFIFFLMFVGAFYGGAIADRTVGITQLDQFFPKLMGGSESKITKRVLDEQSSVIDVTEQSAASVVTVSIKQERRVSSPFFMDPFSMFGQRYRQQEPETETIEQDIGSGFVVDGGLVVTNKHVVDVADAEYKVVDRDDKEHVVKQIYRDPVNDLAILQVEDAQGLSALELGDSDGLKVGQQVIAIGTALGEFRHTVTTGVISGLGRGIEAGDGFGGFVERLDNVIQTDAAINPGNSGGPLLNSIGQVIGINTAVSASAENIGFAIPINVLKESLDNFEETGRFERAFLGVSYQMISKEAALLNEVPAGAYVRQVVEDSAAFEAGIEEGDIITSIGGEKLDDETSLAEIINRKKPGEKVEIKFWRDEEEKSAEVALGSSEE